MALSAAGALALQSRWRGGRILGPGVLRVAPAHLLGDRGPAAAEDGDGAAPQLDERLRQAYFWIVNNAIISPHYDIEYSDGPDQTFELGAIMLSVVPVYFATRLTRDTGATGRT